MHKKFEIVRRWNLAALLLLAALPAFSQTVELKYLPAGQPDGIALLAPPPLPGSPEQAADLSETISVSKSCPPADAAQAKAEKKFSVFVFTPAIGSFFQSNSLPKTTAFFERVRVDSESVTDNAKNFWKRPRPYVVEPSLANGEPEKSFSYPSGHSTRATVFALVLVDLFPDRKDEIMAIGRDVGWHRVEIARHYPTDIYAGRALAQAIVREMKANPGFQHDFAEVKSEIAATRPSLKTAVDTASPIAAHL